MNKDSRSAFSITALLLAMGGFAAGVVDAQEVVFGPPQPITLSAPGSIYVRSAVGDLTGDGRPDAVVGGHTTDIPIRVLVNQGDGSFFNPVTVAPGPVTSVLRLARLNADEHLDLIVANGEIHVRLGAGDGTFGSEAYIFDHVGKSKLVEAFDVTGDSVPDLIVMSGDVNIRDTYLHVLPGLGDGTFGPPVFTDDLGFFSPTSADVGDLDGDGMPDLLVTARVLSDGHARVYLGAGGGTFGAPALIGLGPDGAGRLADVDGDEVLDLILSGTPGTGVMLGVGDGTFEPATVFFAGRLADMQVADFDNDGQLDVAGIQHQGPEAVVFRGHGDGTFTESHRLTSFEEGYSLHSADFDGDGRVDLAFSAVERFVTAPNRTYRPDEPWADLGFSLAEDEEGTNHRPILLAEGTLQGGTEVTINVSRNEVEASRFYLVLGVATVFAPFEAGGIMVPRPDILIGSFNIGAPDGTQPLSGTLPVGTPSGVMFWLQAWFVPTGFATQFAASTAIQATTP